MQNPNRHNADKYAFALAAVCFFVYLIFHQSKNEFVQVILDVFGLAWGTLMFLAGVWIYFRPKRGTRRARKSAKAKVQEILKLIESSDVGPLLRGPTAFPVRISELINTIRDNQLRLKCRDLLDQIYNLVAVCQLEKDCVELNGRVLDWCQYDLCITVPKEYESLAQKTKDALLRVNHWRICVGLTDLNYATRESEQEELLIRVFWASSRKCLALISKETATEALRKQELNWGMQRDDLEGPRSDYLMRVPIDLPGLTFMREQGFLKGHRAEVFQTEGLPDRLAKALATKLRNSKYHNPLDDVCIDQGTIPGDFTIAVSFPTIRQPFVQDVVEELEKHVPGEKIFYYPRLTHVLTGHQLVANLTSFYRNQAELVVVFLCAEYAGSEWCLREWVAILDLLALGGLKAPMLLRLDGAPIPRLSPNIGFIDCQRLGAREISELIVARLTRNRERR